MPNPTPRLGDMSGETPAQRLLLALLMAEAGIAMKRAQLRRQHPDSSNDDVQALLAAWLRDRPDAPHGDYPGQPSARVIGLADSP